MRNYTLFYLLSRWLLSARQLSLAFFVLWPLSFAFAALPPDVKQTLDTFPDKAISVRLVISKALAEAESFKQILSLAVINEIPRLETLAPLDWQTAASLEWQRAQNEPALPFNAREQRLLSHKLSLTKAFSTGTGFSTELTSARNEFDFGSSPFVASFPAFYYESRLTLGITQKLWQDAFGHATRAALASGELGKRAQSLVVSEETEKYIGSLVATFYDAWFAKAKVKAALDGAARRERLAKIMSLKVQRGTAEEPDRLQVLSALNGAKVQLADAQVGLKQRWYSLVLNLKLPEAWLKIDPYDIPIVLDEPTAAAQALCAKGEPSLTAAQKATAVKRAQLQAQAADLKAQAARDSLRPNLSLKGGVSANGIDRTERSETFSEVQDFSHPAWTVGVQLSMPLGHYAEEIRVRQTQAEKIRLNAQAQDAIDTWRRQWLSSCDQLVALEETVKRLEQAFADQGRRAQLEERRYSIGRTSILAVIQAGDDATAAELSLRQAQFGFRQTAWEVLRLNDGYRSTLKGWGIPVQDIEL